MQLSRRARARSRSAPARATIAATAFCGFSLRATLGLRRRERRSPSARPTGSELRSRSGDVHAVVPAGRYQIDAQSDSGATRVRGADRGRGRAVPDPGAEHERRRDRGGRVRDARRSTSRRTCAPPGARCCTWSSGSARASRTCSWSAAGCVLGVRARAAVDRPAAARRHARGWPGGSPRASGARPTACSRRTCRRSRRRRARARRARAVRPPRVLARARDAAAQAAGRAAGLWSLAAAPVAARRSRSRGSGSSGLAGDDGRLVGPWALGPAVGLALCLLAAAGRRRLDRRAGGRSGAAAAQARAGAAAVASGRGAGRCARCWPSGSATAR